MNYGACKMKYIRTAVVTAAIIATTPVAASAVSMADAFASYALTIDSVTTGSDAAIVAAGDVGFDNMFARGGASATTQRNVTFEGGVSSEVPVGALVGVPSILEGSASVVANAGPVGFATGSVGVDNVFVLGNPITSVETVIDFTFSLDLFVLASVDDPSRESAFAITSVAFEELDPGSFSPIDTIVFSEIIATSSSPRGSNHDE